MLRPPVTRARRAAQVALVLLVLALTIVSIGSATAAKETSDTDPGSSLAEGPGLLGAQQYHEAVFTIHARRADGTPVTTGGDPFVVTISEPEPTKVKVKDDGDGTYSVRYTPESVGDYVIAVTLRGESIRDAPFTVPVKAVANAGRSFADGPGVEAAVAGHETSFTIHAVDETGTPRSDGGDDFAVQVLGPKGAVPTQTTDNEDGTYLVRYAPPVPGQYVVKVTSEGKDLQGSPYHVSVTAP